MFVRLQEGKEYFVLGGRPCLVISSCNVPIHGTPGYGPRLQVKSAMPHGGAIILSRKVKTADGLAMVG